MSILLNMIILYLIKNSKVPLKINIKIYKKKLNTIEVNYFTCELDYNEYLYKYQGFFYSGKGGSIQMQYGAQAEAIEQNQNLIDELNNGISILN
jgi:hypothetical protein